MTGVRHALWVAGWPMRRVLVLLIAAYQATLSNVLGGACRFHPSCSEYARLAIERAGAVRGLGLAAWRVLRCSPLTAGGVDHPPSRIGWPTGGNRPPLVYDSILHQRGAGVPRGRAG
jgi:putative membrane protein insertion efficiency factor